MSKSHILLSVFAWLLAVIGGLWALLICFAAGMKTVPRLAYDEVALTLPLPLLAIFTAVLLLRTAGARTQKRRYLFTLLPVLVLSGLALGFVFLMCLLQQ